MGLTLPLLWPGLERVGEPGSVNGLNLANAGLASLVVTPHITFAYRRSRRIDRDLFRTQSVALVSGAFRAVKRAQCIVRGDGVLDQPARQCEQPWRYVALYSVCMAGS